VAGKSAAKAADKVKIAWPDLRALAQHLAGFRVGEVQPATGRHIGQPALAQRGLHLPPILCGNEGLCDEKPKAPEELLVDDFVTPRNAAGVALHLKPHQIAQHGAGCFIPLTADRKELLPQPGVAGKGGIMHHHTSQTARPKLTNRK